MTQQEQDEDLETLVQMFGVSLLMIYAFVIQPVVFGWIREMMI